MAIKNQSLVVPYTAWDTANKTYKTGDVANHAIRVIKDGTPAAAANSPSEVDATNCPGEYNITLTAAEMDANLVVVCGKSSTSDVIIIPVKITTERGTFNILAGSGWAAPGDTLKGIADAVGTHDTTMTGRLTSNRSGYLDNLNVGGLVASAADVAGITQAQRVRVIVPQMLERPDSGSTTYRLWIYAYDEQHQAEDLDNNPTVTAENNQGTDRSANLGSVTKPAGTGVYYVDYTVANGHAIEGLVFKVDATEGGTTTQYAAASIVVDTTAVDFTAADRTKLEAIAGDVENIDGAAMRGTDNAATVAAILAAIIDGSIDLQTVLKRLNAFARGKINKAGDTYAFRNEADDATLFTNTVSDAGRNQ